VIAVSPFDQGILDATAEQAVRMVCPYIGIAYLQHMLAQSTEWLLVTDVNKWVPAGPKRTPF